MAFVTEKEKKKELKNNISNYMKLLFRRSVEEATPQQLFQAVSYAIKDIVVDDWMATHKAYEKKDVKTVYYLSMEFLMGRALGNMIINLKEDKVVREVLDEMGVNLDLLEDEEPDAALGNGGLGRLAACFLDSLSTLGYPAYGCGIRYKYGMFKQKIENGFQIEAPDDWLKDGNPFEMKRPEYAVEVRFGGYVTVRKDEKTGRDRFVQENYQSVMAVPYDLPVVGYGNHIVNTLRIWDAEAIDTFNLDSFDKGDYQKAVEQQNLARTICEVLYPNDNHMAGKELRLKQQYFFVSASVQRAIMKYMENHNDIHGLPEKVCFQLNDTHPTVTVPELMRILLDEYGLEWDDAWDIITRTCAYTNHTIMAEALEKWPLELFSRLLPRIYQITEEINRRFQNEIQAKYPDNQDKVKSMAIIYDGQVKMAHLAIAAGFSGLMNTFAAKTSNIVLQNLDMSDINFLEREISMWKTSPERMMQIKGHLYYDGDHDIIYRKRTAIGEKGELIQVENLPNNRLIDNQYAKLVNQKANYLLGQPFAMESNNKQYAQALKTIFDKRFMKMLNPLVSLCWKAESVGFTRITQKTASFLSVYFQHMKFFHSGVTQNTRKLMLL